MLSTCRSKGEQVGPGGLDPASLRVLPRVLQEAFGERDIDALKTAFRPSAEDAEYHMKRCTDSGLWDPGSGGGAEDSADVVAVQTPSAEVDDETLVKRPRAIRPSGVQLFRDTRTTKKTLIQ